MRSAVVGCLPVALLLWSVVAAADDFLPQAGLPNPIHVRIEGYVGERPAALVAEASWVVEAGGEKYDLHVSHLQILTGDVSASNIIEAAKPYRPTFRLQGDPATLQQFTAAEAGQKIAVSAYLGAGSRNLFLSGIEPLPAPTP